MLAKRLSHRQRQRIYAVAVALVPTQAGSNWPALHADLDMLLPPARFAGEGESAREGRVVPALRDPAGVMYLAHDAQGFDQG